MRATAVMPRERSQPFAIDGMEPAKPRADEALARASGATARGRRWERCTPGRTADAGRLR